MEISLSETGLLKIAGKADVSSAKDVHEALLARIQAEGNCSIDVTSVTGCDASFLQLLFAARKSALRRGKGFSVLGLTGTVSAACAELGVPNDELAGLATGGSLT